MGQWTSQTGIAVGCGGGLYITLAVIVTSSHIIHRVSRTTPLLSFYAIWKPPRRVSALSLIMTKEAATYGYTVPAEWNYTQTSLTTGFDELKKVESALSEEMNGFAPVFEHIKIPIGGVTSSEMSGENPEQPKEAAIQGGYIGRKAPNLYSSVLQYREGRG